MYEKPPVKGRKKKPGARDGHAGARRKTPVAIDARVEHRLPACPCCGGELARCQRTRTRIIEDIPEQIAAKVKDSAVLHADETGWRVAGQTHWLWCFANTDACFYKIDKSRGGPAFL